MIGIPNKPKKPCSFPSCNQLTTHQYCDTHRKQKHRSYDDQRGTAAQRGYSSKWQKARKRHLMLHPLCVHCKDDGKVQAAQIVDHIIPHRGDRELFWSEDNWQSLCAHHHNVKTAKGE